MKTHAHWRAAAAVAAALLVQQAGAQAPGEDPVILKGKVAHEMLPVAPAPKSGNLDGAKDMPAWMRARVSRFEAKAFSADTTGVLTEKDVINTVKTDGLSRTCIQDLGSTTQTARARPGSARADQVVVLRGDVVNICR